MNDFLNPATANDVLSEMIQKANDEKRRAAVASSMTVEGSPDEFNKSYQLSKQVNTPPLIVSKFQKQFEAKARARQVSSLFPDYASTGQWIADPVNMRLVHDDIDALKKYEGTWRSIKASAMNFAKGGGKVGALAVQETGVIQTRALQDTTKVFDQIDGIKGAVTYNILDDGFVFYETETSGLQFLGVDTNDVLLYQSDPSSRAKLRQKYADMASVPKNATYQAGVSAAKWLDESMRTTRAEDEGVLTGFAPSVLGNLAAFVAVAAIPGIGGPAALTTGSLAMGGAQYQDAINSGASEEVAKLASYYGLVPGAIEALPIFFMSGKAGRLLDRALGRAVGRTLTGIAVETGEEVTQGIAFAQIAQSLYDPDRSLFDTLGHDAAAGALGGGVMGILMGILDKRGSYQAGRVDAALRAGDALLAGKLYSRDPAKQAEYVARVTGSETVSIPGEVVKQLYQSSDGTLNASLIQQHGLDEASVRESIATGADLSTSVANYTTNIQPTSQGAAIAEDVKLGEMGISAKEYKRFKENREKVLADLNKTVEQLHASVQPMREVFDQVYKMTRDAGLSETEGRHHAALWAARYESRAQRRGKGETALDLFTKANVSMQTTMYAGDGRSVNQSQQTDTPEFRNWFGGSKAVATDGKPLVVYHGTDADIESFDPDLLGSNTGAPSADVGFFFTSRPKSAQYYAEGGAYDRENADSMAKIQEKLAGMLGEKDRAEQIKAKRLGSSGPNIIPVHLSMQNPLIHDFKGKVFRDEKYRNLIDRAKANGHDGVILRNTYDAGEYNKFHAVMSGRFKSEDIYVVFNPTQIKSAIGNNGNFDPNDPVIRNQDKRGRVTFTKSSRIIQLFAASDRSTLAHETAHIWLMDIFHDAAELDASHSVRNMADRVMEWLNISEASQLTEEMEEKFAKGWEQYLMEGKAPSIGLRGVFADFSRWLTRIYRTVLALNSPVDDNIRGVFDMMLAVDEEIAAAKSALGLKALMTEATADSMTEAEFRTYVARINAADDADYTALLTKSMERIRKEDNKEYVAAAKKIRAEVENDVRNRPAFAALRYLLTGQLADKQLAPGERMYLDKKAIEDAYAESAEAVLLVFPEGSYRNEGGTDPVFLADLFDFAAPRDMLDALVQIGVQQKQLDDAGDKRTVEQMTINAEVQARLDAEYGARMTDQEIQEEAHKEVVNRPREEILAMELTALARKSKQNPTPLWVAREWAKEQIAKHTVRDVASIYRYERAMQKAARQAEIALLNGKFDDAFIAKRQQLLSMLMLQEARRVADKTEKGVALLTKLAKTKSSKSMDQGYLEQIHGLLERVGIMPVKAAASRPSLADFIKSQDPAIANWLSTDMTQPVNPPALVVSYKGMKTADFLDFVDDIKRLRYLGREKDKLTRALDKRDLAAVIENLWRGAAENVPEHMRLEGSWKDEHLSWARSYMAGHRKLEFIVMELDGNQRGAWWRTIYKPLSDASDAEAVWHGRILKEMKTMFSVYNKAEMKAMNEGVSMPTLTDAQGRPRVMTKWDLISLALNMGNEGNIEAIEKGRKWSRDTVMATLNANLTAKDWQFVRSVWQYLDSFWPEIAALEKRLTGVEPERVQATMVQTRFGLIEGGYYPLKADSKQSVKAADLSDAEVLANMAGGVGRASTRHGHTKERIGWGEKAVLLDMSVLFGHINAVVHDLTHREAVIDTYRLMSQQQIKNTLNATIGHEAEEAMRAAIRAVAAGDYQVESFGGFFKYLRGGFVISRMGLNIVNTVQNTTGIFPAIGEVGEVRFFRHAGYLLANPVALAKALRWVGTVSPMMADRWNSSSVDMRDLQDQIDPRATRIRGMKRTEGIKWMGGVIRRFSMAVPAATDFAVATVVWVSAYQKAMAGEANGFAPNNQAEAVTYADSVVRTTTSSGRMVDRAGLQRGSEASKTALSTLMGYFLTMANRFINQTKAVFRGQMPPMRYFLNFVYANSLTAILSELVVRGMPDEDEEEWPEWLLRVHLSWLAAGFIGVRDASSVILNDYAPKGVIGTLWSDAERLATQMGQGEADVDLVKAGLNVVGIVARLPTKQIVKTTDGISRASDGEDLDWWEMMIAPPLKK